MCWLAEEYWCREKYQIIKLNEIHTLEQMILILDLYLQDCVRYIFTFFMSKREHLWNKEKCFLFHVESSFRSWDN